MDQPPIIQETETEGINQPVNQNKIISKKHYYFKINNSEYNLQVEFYSNYINFRLIEIKENSTISLYIKQNLDLTFFNIDNEVKNDLNKIIELIDIAYNEGKLKIIIKQNNINILLKLKINNKEIEKKILLKKGELSINEKMEFILNEMGKFKNKNIEIDEKILKNEKILNDVKLNLQLKEKEKISEIENLLKEVKETINNQLKENETIYKALKDIQKSVDIQLNENKKIYLKFENQIENLNE